MPGRRKTSAATAVIEEPESVESRNIESVAKEEVDEHVKPLLESATVVDFPDIVPDEDRLRELMSKMLHAREKAQVARERVREINTELVEKNQSTSDKLKEKYQKAIEELTSARRAANLTRAEFFAAMKGWHRSLRMAY